MDKCPFCGAETRPGDNFCLNCGNRLPVPTSSSQQAQPAMGDATLPAPDDWAPPAAPTAQSSSWNDPDLLTIASTSAGEPATVRADAPAPVAQAVMNKIDNPAHLVLRSDTGEVLNEYTLDRAEMSIGRAPNSDVLLSKDKLTSRRHATILYENGQYFIRDERSANGTFVNSQQLEQMVSRQLNDGDQIGIGEHELLFKGTQSGASAPDIDSMPTITVSPSSLGEMTYRTREDELQTSATSDDYGTRSMNGGSEAAPFTPPSAPEPEAPQAPQAPQMQAEPEPAFEAASAPASPAPTPEAVAPSTNQADTSGVTFNRLTNLSQPSLPDVAPLAAALSALDGQVASLQEQLNATQEAMRNHDSEVAQTANQLRSGVRSVSDRMDKTIADVARNREQLAWAELSQLMEDVMNNPRDIEYVTKLARKARELNKVFQIHQNVLNTLAECTSLLRSLIGEDR
ncbi:MAG TPA: FHA domain-containing protein [Ktedonobacteraceae bacterium]|nr:FHA domain-containing protein [Ktedonobacteraceae bacterium]